MVLGTQWYILFNVIAGASAFPTDLREASTIYRLRTWQWWRDVILPGIFPYYVTGALTASGRLLERQHRRRGRELGRHQAGGCRSRRLYRQRDRGRRFSAGGSRHRRHVDLRGRLQPVGLATDVWIGRAALPPELTEIGPERNSAMDTAVSTPAPAAVSAPAAAAGTLVEVGGVRHLYGEGGGAKGISSSRTSTCACAATRSSPCWVAPAAASPRCCASSPGCSSRPPERSRSAAPRSMGRPARSPWCSRALRCFPG